MVTIDPFRFSLFRILDLEAGIIKVPFWSYKKGPTGQIMCAEPTH